MEHGDGQEVDLLANHYENDIDAINSETSDEEDVVNTVGNVPLEWYRFHDHIGYDKAGRKVSQLHKSQIDDLVERVGQPNAWRTIKDIYNGKELHIDMDTIIAAKRMVANHLASDDIMEKIQVSPQNNVLNDKLLPPPYKESNTQASKRYLNSQQSFALRLLRNWMQKKISQNDLSKKKRCHFYDLWATDVKLPGYVRRRKNLPPPSFFKPGHCESYNPPEEYLFTDKEKEQWNHNHPALRSAFSCIPDKSSSLSLIKNDSSGFMQFISDRCQSLYSMPRVTVNRLPSNLKSQDLLPQVILPPCESKLRLEEKLRFFGHKSYITASSVHKNGIHLASSSNEGLICIWNIRTARCIKSFNVNSAISQISWLPVANCSIIAYSYDKKIILQSIELSSNPTIHDNNVNFFKVVQSDSLESPKGFDFIQKDQNCLEILHPEIIKIFNWHPRGNYLSVVFKKPKNHSSVIIHNIRLRQTRIPFQKLKGIIVDCIFHQSKPTIFLISHNCIKSYDLLNLENRLLKIEIPHSEPIVCASLHKSGQHIVVGCHNGRIFWFDLELTLKPLKTLNCHKEQVNGIILHQNQDLMCSASEDGTCVLYEAKVFNDLLTNPEIMPLRKLSGHSKTAAEPGVTCITFASKHNNHIISGGHDKILRLFA